MFVFVRHTRQSLSGQCGPLKAQIILRHLSSKTGHYLREDEIALRVTDEPPPIPRRGHIFRIDL